MVDETNISIDLAYKLLDVYKKDTNLVLQLIIRENIENSYYIKIYNKKHNLIIIAKTLEEYFEILIMYKELENDICIKK
jgi:hypothetical protein